VTRWTAQQATEVKQRLERAIRQPLMPIANPVQRKRGKYGNQRTVFQGQKFDSGREEKVWRDLQVQWLAGAIRAVVRQVSMPLPQSTRRIRVDFMLVELDGKVRWLDAKGFETAWWRSKRDQVKSAYGIEIELI
jgi:hypothetical protein